MAGFYDEHPEAAFLMGDVVVGFHAVVPSIHRPGPADDAGEVGIAITRPAYFAIMTPCCSVGNRQISVAPLVPIKGDFFKNPYFAEDLTRINVQGPPDKITPPDVWERMSATEKASQEAAMYGVGEAFIYAEDTRLKRYDMKISRKGTSSVMSTGFYMLEFGSAFRINCDQVVRNKPAPNGIKLLQLSVSVRQELREKISKYFGRTPTEDRVLLNPQ